MNVAIGIDPGQNGAIAVLEGSQVKYIFSMPQDSNGVDLIKLHKIFESLANEYLFPPARGFNCHVALEKVHSVFGASAESNFTFGGNCKILEYALVSNGFPWTHVQPKEWQKVMWQGVEEVKKTITAKQREKQQEKLDKAEKEGKKVRETKPKTDTKKTSELAVKRIFPNQQLTDPKSKKATKPHDGIVDAILIAEYCRRKLL